MAPPGQHFPKRVCELSTGYVSPREDRAKPTDGFVYVLNDLNVLKFGANATGNVAPVATISFVGFSGVTNIAAQ
jgi:hypothetical protein